MEDLIQKFLLTGDGDGDGDGDGLKQINNQIIYAVDGVPTVFDQIRGHIARGGIVWKDFTIEPCFIIKENGCFAHGSTLHEAAEALQDKLFDEMPAEERISNFVKLFLPGVLYRNTDYFDWHHRLTGSCKAGREAFARDHAIDLNDFMTPEAFCELTKDAYGGEIIRELAKHYPDASIA